MANSIQLNCQHDEENESDPNYQSNSNSMSSQSQKIKKVKSKRSSRKSGKSSSSPVEYNYQQGRPGKPGDSNEENLNSTLKEILSEKWFGINLATQLLIFFCQKGNMIFKIKTGQPAAINAGRVRQQLDGDAQKKIRKFKKQFKKQLKQKHYSILRYLGYPDSTTYLFLQNNKYHNASLSLPISVSLQTRQGLEVISKYLSPWFYDTYKLMIEYFYFEQDKTEDYIIQTVIAKLKANQQDHKMIFDMQLIQELMRLDNQVMQSMDNSPSEAEIHLLQTTSITIPNFDSRTFKDQKDAIFNQSSWIFGFLDQLFQILSQNP